MKRTFQQIENLDVSNFSEEKDLPVANFTRSHHPQLNQGLDYPKRRRINIPWITASSTHNYMRNDGLVDWLQLYYNDEVVPYHSSNEGFLDYIKQRGVEFENELVQYISKNIFPVVFVSKFYSIGNANETVRLMKDGVPILHSAPVYNKKNKTYGIIDLLVRSDFLNRLVSTSPIDEKEETIPAPKLGAGIVSSFSSIGDVETNLLRKRRNY